MVRSKQKDIKQMWEALKELYWPGYLEKKLGLYRTEVCAVSCTLFFWNIASVIVPIISGIASWVFNLDIITPEKAVNDVIQVPINMFFIGCVYWVSRKEVKK